MAMHSDTFTIVFTTTYPLHQFLNAISTVKLGNSIQLLTKATKKQKQIRYYAKTDTVRSVLVPCLKCTMRWTHMDSSILIDLNFEEKFLQIFILSFLEIKMLLRKDFTPLWMNLFMHVINLNHRGRTDTILRFTVFSNM